MGASTVGILIYVAVSLLAVSGGPPKRLNPEAKLTKYIIDAYSRIGHIARPVLKSTDTLKVNVGLALIHIDDLNVEKSVLSLNAWLRLAWTDLNLKWDPKDFEQVSELRLPVKYIWTPDIVLYNKGYIDGYGGMRITDDAMAVVSHDGSVLWIPPVNIVSLCNGVINDTAHCSVKLGSWTYDGYMIDLGLFDGKESIDLADYYMDTRYIITDTKAVKETIHYPCCKEPYPDVRFKLAFKFGYKLFDKK